MILCFDSETTGLPVWAKPGEDPCQPHLVELAAQLVTPGNALVEQLHAIVRPDGWTIPAEVAAIHGITNERAMDEGRPEAEVLQDFMDLAAQADDRVAYNESFDARIIRIALSRFLPASFRERREHAPRPNCPAARCAKLLRLPPTAKMLAAGRRHFKTPNLGEVYQHLFGEPLAGAHGAMADCEAVRRVWFHLNPPILEAAAPSAA